MISVFRQIRAMARRPDGLAEARFFNTLCLAYGGVPVHYSNFVASGLLPPDRDCVGEYNQIKQAFATTIYPFIDQNLMRKVQQREWFLPSEMN
jgi:hypothetical protein